MLHKEQCLQRCKGWHNHYKEAEREREREKMLQASNSADAKFTKFLKGGGRRKVIKTS